MLQGKVVWVWNWRRCDGGDAAKVAKRLRDSGSQAVMVKAWDGPNWFNQGKTLKDIVAALKKASPELRVGAWGFDYPNDPAGEAVKAVESVTHGAADFLMLDVEGHFEGHPAEATQLCEAIRAKLPDIPLYYSTFAIPSFHRSFPYAEFEKHCDGAAPQVHAKYWLPPVGNLYASYEAALSATYAGYQEVGSPPARVYPVIDLWQEAAHPSPSAAEVGEFAQFARNSGSPGISTWSYEHMQSGRLWPRWSGVTWPGGGAPTPPPPPPPPARGGLTMSQYTELKGRLEKVEADVKRLKRRAPEPTGRTHTVRSGDTLSGLAEKYYGEARRWPEIHGANAGIIGPNPDVLRVGQVLTIP